MTDRRQTARLLLTLLLAALAASACQRRTAVACAEFRPAAAPVWTGDEVTLRIDYAAAEAMIAALERDALSDAAVDSLLGVHGVRMTVDNVTRLIPELGRAEFRTAMQQFVRNGRIPREHAPFNLRWASSERARIQALLTWIRENESAVLQRTLAMLDPYTPDTGPLHLTAYLVAGGTSTGFVPDTPGGAEFFLNLADAQGDCEGVLLHIAHETYHLVQKAAHRRVPGLAVVADSVESLSVPERILATALLEGSADLVADPRRSSGDGPAIASQRERYRLDAEPERMRETFAIFDTVFHQAVQGEITWEIARDRGFMSDPRFYALGREMAHAIEQHCGAPCIRQQFEQPPVEFFREYIRLYRAHPQIVGRFAPLTERLLGADP